MKKRLKYLYYAIAIIAISSLIFVACSQNESSDTVPFNTTVLKVNKPYLDQKAYVSGGDSEADMDYLVKNKLYMNMEDTNVNWTYFDNLYDSSLSTSIRQELSYIILCKKDLIGLVTNRPDDAVLVAALKKHVDNLVETNYLGYTVLYYALDVLKSTGKEVTYVKAKAATIVQYASNDSFHPNMIADGAEGVGSQDLYDKVVDNYSYVSKIETLK